MVLPHHIGPDLNAEERASIGQHIQMGSFAKVILIHLQGPATALVPNRFREGAVSRPGAMINEVREASA